MKSVVHRATYPKTLIATEGRVSEALASYNKRRNDHERPGQQQLDLGKVNGNGSNFRDPAFADNKVQPIHRWVPWIAGFSSQFVEDCFQTFLTPSRCKNKPLILDPFAGVGTTLVSALLKGHDSVGFEINAYAALASRVKLSATQIDPAQLEKYSSEYLKVAPSLNGTIHPLKPLGFRSRIPFFSPEVEKQVIGLLWFIQQIPDQLISDVFRIAFGSVMVSFSNYTYEPSLTTRPGAGKALIEHADVAAVIVKKIREILNDIRWLSEELKRVGCVAKNHVHNMNFMDAKSVLSVNAVDFMVTSPPYMNNYHYVRNTRPHLYWLSLVKNSDDLKTLEEANVGKYWQTVRASSANDLLFHHESLANSLRKLRRTRQDKGVYGGSGWANYVTSYFNDSYKFLQTLKFVLKRNAVGVIVIGNSIIQGYEFKTECILADIASLIGLKVEGIQNIRSKRVGASITRSTVRRGGLNKAVLYESAVIVRKR